ncbi:MAG: bifunctional diguanylate cyclase/phosphodiesterase [Wenzhouxiangella sp.]|nr:MAG: bifunctional diguanylate cyclase/phosphodiesterase [Wenzhouxiangella sp.]
MAAGAGAFIDQPAIQRAVECYLGCGRSRCRYCGRSRRAPGFAGKDASDGLQTVDPGCFTGRILAGLKLAVNRPGSENDDDGEQHQPDQGQAEVPDEKTIMLSRHAGSTSFNVRLRCKSSVTRPAACAPNPGLYRRRLRESQPGCVEFSTRRARPAPARVAVTTNSAAASSIRLSRPINPQLSNIGKSHSPPATQPAERGPAIAAARVADTKAARVQISSCQASAAGSGMAAAGTGRSKPCTSQGSRASRPSLSTRETTRPAAMLASSRVGGKARNCKSISRCSEPLPPLRCPPCFRYTLAYRFPQQGLRANHRETAAVCKARSANGGQNMSASERASGTPQAALLLAFLILIAALAANYLFYRSLVDDQDATLERHVRQLAEYVHADMLDGVNEQILAHQRMAARFDYHGLEDWSGWQREVSLFKSHHAFYHAIGVLDPELEIIWIEQSDAATSDARLIFAPARYHAGALREASQTGEFVIARPVLIPGGRFTLTFYHPIGVGVAHRGFLAATFSVPDAVERMISDMFRDELKLRVRSRGEIVFPYPEPDEFNTYQWQAGFAIDLDGDGDAMEFEFGLSESSRQQYASALPRVAIIGGSAVSLLLAIVTFLALNAGRHANVLARSNNRLEQEIRERELAEQEMELLVTHDTLTGLPNRTGSTRYLERILADSEGEKGQLALMFFDLDQFKDINDSLGHQLGDQLLCEIPRRLATVLKDRDFVGRHGGDEFLIAAIRPLREDIEQLAINILRSLDHGFAIDDNRFFVSASIGIAYYSESGETVADLIQNADTALFKAKNAGRNQFAVFTREMFSQAQHRLNLSRDIRHALDAGQFRVVYQPIVSVKDLSLVGLEALLRWQHEKGYQVPPQEFIRVAEETGVIGRLGEFALERALSDLAEWKKSVKQPPGLAVNVSGAQVREGDFAEKLSMLLHRYRIQPELIHLEITEEVLIENLMRNRRMLEKLNDIGMRIVVDDFGVGYSSLAYLKNFPISVVKIDRGFIQDLADDHEDQAITRTICSLAGDLGMQTVAEGVERLDQLELLRQFKCDFAQGFLFSRPVEAEAISTMLTGELPWRNVATEAHQ